MIVLPGGGYAAYAENEAEPIVSWLRGLGIEASVSATRSTSVTRSLSKPSAARSGAVARLEPIALA
jgi:hypothetical protein